jgi:uncharacterized membrane protein YcaP (DUF421 family)
MDLFARAFAVYLVLMLLFRITGKRSLAQVSTFDFVLLLVVGEATQQALLGDDFSITTAAVVIAALLVIDRGADFLGYRFPKLGRAIESMPLILMDDGKLLRDRMRRVQITEQDILSSARERHGIERLDQVKYAVLEQSGGISIIPREA